MPRVGIDGGFDLPFQEQITFFRQKLNLPTERWDDIRHAAHDRAFVVAGAMKADLLDDLRQAVDKAIATGTTLATFRKDFRQIVGRHGWQGWTGEGSKAGFDWRTKVIYETNLRSSHAAARWAQMNDPAFKKLFPYWRYIHNDGVLRPRPMHKRWGDMRLTLPADDAFWQSHYPPNGWGCRCRVTAAAGPAEGDSTAPPEGWNAISPATGAPAGIDKGWGYAPGAQVAPLLQATGQKMEKAARPIAREYCATLRGAPVFERFLSGRVEGEFPVAVLDEATQALLESQTCVVSFSQASAAEHAARHPEITVADYRKIQQMLDSGQIYRQGDERLIYLWSDEKAYRAAIKRTADGGKNYLLTLFRNTKEKPPKGAVRIR